jgi:LmbE family N-acetylglucosaminyl deacetylase
MIIPENFTTTYDAIVIGPHPDDVEFEMAGTIMKITRSGRKVLSLCLTKGEMSTHGTMAEREKEFAAACALLGCDGLQLDLPDTDVQNTRENRLRIARIIRKATPAIIFAPHPHNPVADLGGVSNVDHYTTGALVRDAVKMARLQKTIPDLPRHEIKKLYLFMLPRSVQPTVLVDVSDIIEDIRNVFRAYTTQMNIRFMGGKVEPFLMTTRAANGALIGVAYAERFASDMSLVFEAKSFFEV